MAVRIASAAGLALLSLSGVSCVPSAELLAQKEHPGPLGDLTPAERLALLKVDPGLENSLAAGGSARTRMEARYHKHANESNTDYGEFPASRLGEVAHVKVTNATSHTDHGAEVVDTDHGEMPAHLYWFRVGWRWEDRPRRAALLVVEMIEDYRPFLGYLVPKISPLVAEFREQGLPVFFTNWARRPNDGLYGALDRSAGVRGFAEKSNIQYTYSDYGLYPMKELTPTEGEIEAGRMIRSIHLNKFTDLDADGRSILAERLRALGVDTLVIVGGLADACVMTTAFAGLDSFNFDVSVVQDAIGTETGNQQAALSILKTGFDVPTASGLLHYFQEHSGDEKYLLPPADPMASLEVKATVSDKSTLGRVPTYLAPSLILFSLVLTAVLVVAVAPAVGRHWAARWSRGPGGADETLYVRTQPGEGV